MSTDRRFFRRSLFLAPTLAIIAFVSTLFADPVTGLGRTAIAGVPQDVGFVNVQLVPAFPGTVGYLNVVAHGITSSDWLVQNDAIPMNPGEFGQFGAHLSTTFNLTGFSPAGSYDVYASFTSSPMPSPNPGLMQLNSHVPFTIYDIGDLISGTAAGRDAGQGTSGQMDPKALHAAGGVAAIIGRVRHDIPGIKQGKNECAPTSAAQSLQWLRDRYGMQGLPNQATLISDLKTAMKWDPDGIDPRDFKPGKDAIVTKYKLGVTNKRGGQFDGTGTFDFIKGEIEHGEDVEMRIQYPTPLGGHWVTIAGWFDDGTTRKLYFKDPLTGGNTVDEYTITGTTITNYKYGAGTVSFAVSQSIPEPATVVLLAIGLVLLATLPRVRSIRA